MFDYITSEHNLTAAADKLCKGKTNRRKVRKLLKERAEAIAQLSTLMREGGYRCGEARHMVRREKGKVRRITYADVYPDALVRHAVCRVLKARAEPKMDEGVCANIERRGSLYCINKAKEYIQRRRYKYCLQEDIHHYFESIDQELLLKLVRHECEEDERTLELVREMLKLCPEGAAIGTYDSQLWANVYLMALDRAVRRKFPEVGYIRYCDNLYLLSNDLREVHAMHNYIRGRARRLQLRLNPCTIQACEQGVRVLHVVIFPTHTRLRRRVREAMKRSNNIASYFGFAKDANSKHLLRIMAVKKFGDLLNAPEYLVRFTGDKRPPDSLIGKRLIITGCRIERGKFKTADGERRLRAVVAFKFDEEEDREFIFFSSSQAIIKCCEVLLSDEAKYLPMEATLAMNGKQLYFKAYED